MSFGYMVDLAKLDESLSDMTTFDGKVATHLEALDKVVAQLQGEWHGEAATTQKDAHTRWTAGAAGMRKALAEMRAAGKVAHTNYTNAATANQKMWKQVR